MWAYEKKLQYPVKIKNPNLTYAKIIISQLGGPDGELAAATRYLNQRYSMPNGEIIGILTDIGTEVPLRNSLYHHYSRQLLVAFLINTNILSFDLPSSNL